MMIGKLAKITMMLLVPQGAALIRPEWKIVNIVVLRITIKGLVQISRF
jgi:hypothetical protein